MTKPPRQPWHPPEYEVADIEAVQALARDPNHKRALDWISRASGGYDETFHPDEGIARYLQGRRSVWLAIVKMINYPPAALESLRKQKRK